jgi:hypothetical protein
VFLLNQQTTMVGASMGDAVRCPRPPHGPCGTFSCSPSQPAIPAADSLANVPVSVVFKLAYIGVSWCVPCKGVVG